MLVTRPDVTDSASIEAAVAAGIERFSRIDALVNNAGTVVPITFYSRNHNDVIKQM